MKKHFLFLPVVLFLFTVSIFAQTPNPSPTPPADDEDVVKISTTLIQVDVSVTDKEGKQVTDIKPEEFEVFENGSKQEITNFSYISVAPRTNAEATRSEIRAKNKLDKINLIPPVPTKLKPNEVRRTIALVVDDLGIAFSGLASTKDTLKDLSTNRCSRMIWWRLSAPPAAAECFSSLPLTKGCCLPRSIK